MHDEERAEAHRARCVRDENVNEIGSMERNAGEGREDKTKKQKRINASEKAIREHN